MAAKKNCKHQGFAYAKGYKNVKIICDYDGEVHPKEYCYEKCENYEPRKEGD